MLISEIEIEINSIFNSELKGSKRSIKIKQKLVSEYMHLEETHQEVIDIYQKLHSFKSNLHPFQIHALNWMIARQTTPNSDYFDKRGLDPLWRFYHATDISFYFNPFFGNLSFQKPAFTEKCKGGILGDQMGLGKTVMVIGLLHALRRQRTLIVVPKSVINQWQMQIINHSEEDSLQILVYYQRGQQDLLKEYDVVITTYGKVYSDFKKNNKGLFKHTWNRIVIDEAHQIRNSKNKISNAVFHLKGQIKWCLTGTPIQNKIQDVFSLIHFIEFQPWSNKQFWKNYITLPNHSNDPQVLQALKLILKPIFLRRTKQTKINGLPILELPSKTNKIREVQLSEPQRHFYQCIYQKEKKSFDELQQQGILQTKFMMVLQIILKLRQVCDHIELYKNRTNLTNHDNFEQKLNSFLLDKQVINEDKLFQKTNTNTFTTNFKQQQITKVMNNQYEKCLICFNHQVFDPVMFKCLHIFCKNCYLKHTNIHHFCPACREPVDKKQILYLPNQNLSQITTNTQSSKLKAVISQILSTQQDDKIVVYSQFLLMMTLIQKQLQTLGISYVRLDGKTSISQRKTMIKKFQSDPKVKIFLASLKAGGVGLNLVSANKVYLVQPWWNPSMQDQAIDRVHRIGQKREVQVVRFIVNNSIESRMVQMHECKRKLMGVVLEQKGKSSLQIMKHLLSKY